MKILYETDMSESTQSVKDVQLEKVWKQHLQTEFEEPYMKKLRKFLVSEIKNKNRVFPQPSEYFQALNITPFDEVKVVMLGQDPYHGVHQAHGLCFSVRSHIAIPPSLKNIFSELKRDLGIPYPNHGCLEYWAVQGVLLLNSVLTVNEGRAGSHQNRGWEEFTDKILSLLNIHKEHLVFMLWGSYAHRKGQFIDRDKHLVLTAPHPSPLSVHRGFFGCSHFSKANDYLKSKGETAIDWSLPSILPSKD